MKEDVLEQIVDDYLKFKGYFTAHNIRFRPSPSHESYVANQDRVFSDVDVIGYHPRRDDIEKVVVVTCKSWQKGLNAGQMLAQLRGEAANPRRLRWKQFRELWIPKWSEAFRSKVAELTGEETFAYRIAVTRLRGVVDAEAWRDDPTIKANLKDCDLGFLTLEEMWSVMLHELSTTPAASEMGRLIQLLKAAGLTAPRAVLPPSPPVPGSDAALEDELEERLVVDDDS